MDGSIHLKIMRAGCPDFSIQHNFLFRLRVIRNQMLPYQFFAAYLLKYSTPLSNSSIVWFP